MSQESCVCGFCDGTKCGNNTKPNATKEEVNHWPNGVPQRYAKRCTCVEGLYLSCPKHGFGNR